MKTIKKKYTAPVVTVYCTNMENILTGLSDFSYVNIYKLEERDDVEFD